MKHRCDTCRYYESDDTLLDLTGNCTAPELAVVHTYYKVKYDDFCFQWEEVEDE